jgi:Domain of unknown function (DUF929)
MANKRRTNPAATGKHSQQRQEARQNRTTSAQNQRNRRRRVASRRSPWLLLGGAVILIAVIVGFFLFLSNQSQPSNSTKSSNSANTSADATTFKEVTNVDPNLLSQIGNGGLSNPFELPKGSPSLLTGSDGKPEIYYEGGEFCPYCAAERWGMVVAMSRFGTFHNLRETTSLSTDTYPSTSTFTFYQSSYSSSYVDFVPVEAEDQQESPLQTPTADEQQLFNTYDAPPYTTSEGANSFPFIDIGNRYIDLEAGYSPALLRTNPQDPTSSPLSQQDIASQLTTENQLSKGILGTANYLTAATCAITNNRPSTVCSDSSIQKIEASLSSGNPSVATINSTLQATLGPSPIADIWRRSM